MKPLLNSTMRAFKFLFVSFVSLALMYSCGGPKPKETTSATPEADSTETPADDYPVKEETKPVADFSYQKNVQRIAFGSCGSQDRPWPILKRVLVSNPDLFVFLGDNIYGDTKVMDTLKAKYDRLGNKQLFKDLVKQVQTLATWDDHDFGWNDSGRHYKYKEASKDLFMEFWNEPVKSPRRERKGIYCSYLFESEAGKKVQVILLDTRTFRDNLQAYNGEKVNTEAYHYELDYWPNENPDSTFLGKEQWLWLEEQFRAEADVRVIGSSTQFGIGYNGYEAWANVPREREKMVELIKSTGAENTVFISGDVHYAEVSKLEAEGCYPLYDFTSSGITSTWKFATPNSNRIDGAIMENHFGLLSIDWDSEELRYQVIDLDGATRIDRKVALAELKFSNP